MIGNSYHWRDDLRRFGASLRRRAKQRRWTDRSFSAVEKELLLGWFIIRRFIDSDKTPDRVRDSLVELMAFPMRPGRSVTRINWLSLERNFDLNAERREKVRLNELANQFIHSRILVPLRTETNGVAGYFVRSDWGLKRKSQADLLLFVTFEEIAEAFERVASAEVKSGRFVRNVKGDYDRFLD